MVPVVPSPTERRLAGLAIAAATTTFLVLLAGLGMAADGGAGPDR